MFEKKYILMINIIDDCNLNCRYCYNIKPYNKKLLDLDITFNKIKKFRKEFIGHILINITGGEPTLHPDLMLFVKKISKLDNITINIYSNLTLALEKIIQILQISNNINFIFTCHDNFNCYHIVNSLKIFEKQLEFHIMFEDYNINESIHIYKNIKQIISNTQLIKIFNTHLYHTKYSAHDINEYKKITKCKDTLNLSETNSEEDLSYLSNTCIFKYWKCFSASSSLYIHNNGDCYYCPSYYNEKRKKVYNIYISDIHIKTKYILCECNLCSNYVDIEKYKIFNTKTH